uniref:Uncharacterized protein n=1 Tax=Setaria italica TaxID=4555 RepID=K3ZB30_SETIT
MGHKRCPYKVAQDNMKGKSFHQKIKYRAPIYGRTTCNDTISNSRMIYLRRLPQMGTLCSEFRYIESRTNIRVPEQEPNQNNTMIQLQQTLLPQECCCRTQPN